jgi:hypothetical protein
MICKLKAAGLALVAVFALSAVLASAASAQVGTLTSSGPVTLIGTPTGEASVNQITALGGTLQCPNVQYTGHKALSFKETEPPEGRTHEMLPNDSSTTTITPHYGVCVINPNNLPATVDMNGCDYVLHLEGTTPGVDTDTIKFTIECPVGKHIKVTLFSTGAKHMISESFCHIIITENPIGYLGLHATQATPTTGKISVSGKISGITAHKTSPSGSILCPEETTSTATLALDIAVEGRNEGGVATSISLSHL